MIKYLYGKKAILTPLIEGKVGFRFSDLSHYARIENDLMRDDEMSKTFIIDKFSGELRINGDTISPEDMAQDPKLTIPTRHCFCLCLSNRGDSDELYERFQADVCIEVKSDFLINFLNDFLPHKLPSMEVIGRDITYYGRGQLPRTHDPRDLVFYKPESFTPEAEFRIALFYPSGKRGFKASSGEAIPFIDERKSTHMTISYPDKNFLKQFIGNTFEQKA